MGYAILDQRGGDSITATTLDGYSLLADTTVSSATTTVTFNGLNIGWGDELLLVSTHLSNISTPFDVYLFINNDNTPSNYSSQFLDADNSYISSSRSFNPLLFYAPGYSRNFIITKIKLTNSGYFVYQSEVTRDFISGSPRLNKIYGSYMWYSFSAINSLSVSSSVANGIFTGSRFQLYKSGGGASRTWAIT